MAQDVWRLRRRLEGGARRARRALAARPTAAPTSPPTGLADLRVARTRLLLSPKAALSWQWLRRHGAEGVARPRRAHADGGRAVRRHLDHNSQFINDPNLQPEKSWTGELSAEKDLGNGLARLTLFAEDTRDSLYSQTVLDPVANSNISRVQNVGHIAPPASRLAFNSSDVLLRRASTCRGSVTYADSKIKDNAGFVATPGDTIGKWQPQHPALARHGAARATASTRTGAPRFGARYSGRQYRTLNNARHQRLRLPGRQPVLHDATCACAAAHAAVDGGVRRRQR